MKTIDEFELKASELELNLGVLAQYRAEQLRMVAASKQRRLNAAGQKSGRRLARHKRAA